MNDAKRTTLNDIPAIILEQAALGDLPPERLREIEALPGWAEYKAALARSDAAILAACPAELQLPAIRAKAARSSVRSWRPATTAPAPRNAARFVRFSALAVPVAAAVLFVLALLQPGTQLVQSGPDAVDPTRAKGQAGSDASAHALQASRDQRLARLRAAAGLVAPDNAADALTISVRSAKELIRTIMAEQPQLEIWRQTDGKAEVLKPGATVKAFDNLQIAYLAAGKPFGMIISLDGRGRLTLHYPESFSAVPVLDQGTPTVLGFAYQLDDAPRFERFFFITSDRQFQVNTIWSLLEKQLAGADVPAAWAVNASPNLPAGFESSSFLLNK